ncbi:Ankyrin repeat domain-containing protein [Thalictrum thalictroides]|uniref:Ankyrin repeat domain-containing protein n=1 Tax=Thalictrum thalictroides TaxID=46969 RepID=A0A7J6WLK7_THATH|nr:Ankyrin repeat domain-containing protein [Thalictrum thalictroides]
MTVFSHNGGGFLTGKQVFPVNCESEVSQRLVEASHTSDLKSALECVSNPFVDVNFIGAVCLKTRKTEVVLHDESANEVRIEYDEFRTDVTALFLAAHDGNLTLVQKLLSVGADVNQKLFRGFATTAAVREGHFKILEILLKAGASQPACEEALLEASCHGRARLSELLMGSDMIRPHVAVHALVMACCRGFVDVVDSLIKCGVDVNAIDRILLQSSRPSLHTNADCTALVAAVVNRHVPVVRQLLQIDVRTDILVRIGAWSWDTNSGEEFKVGAGLAEPYHITWCAVEYFEASGVILRMLLQNQSPNTPHYGRTLIHHAILCRNAKALDVLLNCGADVEIPVKTTQGVVFRPIHMAARLGSDRILQRLIDAGCDLNSQTDSGETALMISAKYKKDECFRVLASAGADFGMVNSSGQSVCSIAVTSRWSRGFQHAVLNVIHSGSVVRSSNASIFSPLLFVAHTGDIEAMKVLVKQPNTSLDDQDDKGLSALMVTAMEGHVEAFRLLVYAGANLRMCNKSGKTAISLSELNQNCDLFEKVLLEFALEKGNQGGFRVLHSAARRGDLSAVQLLIDRGYDVNVPDQDDYTPLMLAAKEGHYSMCELLISCGARCDVKTARGETALSLARNSKNARVNTERVILDELARTFVLSGFSVKKHTKKGKGSPHQKMMRMVGAAGVLRWGKSSRRNVICREAEMGPSSVFERNRRRKGDAYHPGVFRIITTKNKEFHFVCEGGAEMAEMWVRGIKLVTREAIFGKKSET